MEEQQGIAPWIREKTGRVGIVSEGPEGLEQIACLMSRERVGLSKVLVTDGHEGAGMVDGLRTMQADPGTEMVIVVLEQESSPAVEGVLAQVQSSDKPTVVCLLGGDPRRVWKAGAIPAERLDEAALRAVAWMRGWDQALITSRLEKDDDQLAARAQVLRQRLGPARHRIVALMGDGTLYYEAQVMVSGVAGRRVEMICEVPNRLSEVLAEPSVAAVLVRVAVAPKSEIENLVATIRRVGTDGIPLVLVHVCGLEPGALARSQEWLRQAGAIVLDSNAAAAQLAALVVAG
jgi:hypothetical protein